MMNSPRSVMLFGEDAKWDAAAAQTATPLPKHLIRSKKVFAGSDHTVKPTKGDEMESEDDETENQKFMSFASTWAKQDEDENFKCDLLDDLEDTMEAVMAVADKVVKLTGKIKRNLRNNKK